MSTSKDRVILAQFPDCPLAPLEGLPNYAYLTEFNRYLNACTSDIFTNGGCGKLDYLVLTAPPATFVLLCNAQFIVPTNPSPSFQIPTGPVTAAVLSELMTKYIKELGFFKEYYDVDKAVKAKIQQYIQEKFYQTLIKKITGFSKVITLTILTHLWTTYGLLKEEDIQDFDKSLKTAISADTCFEDFIDQIEDNTDAISSQNPYSPAQIVSIAYTIVNTTGFYLLHCKTWRHKPAIDQTWANFKLFSPKYLRTHRMTVSPCKLPATPPTSVNFRRTRSQ